jgi:coenzyme F420-reducing hydrogenase beta subunit
MNKLLAPRDIVRSGLCIGCGSCVGRDDSAETIMHFDDLGQYKPHGPASWYKTPSAAFTRTCPFSPAAKNEDQLSARLFANAAAKHTAVGPYREAFVGHVSESNYREQGSSGGMVTWVAAELLRTGLVDGVAHVIATTDPQANGKFFQYRIARTLEEVREGAKSRYYPVEMSEVLRMIREVPGRYAVVGIPCFIKAIQLLRAEDLVLQQRIKFTLGLFCGHMKSARFSESLAWQMNVPVSKVNKVEFRYKDANRPANWYNAMLMLRDGSTVNKDWWHLADGDWGAGFFMNEACNYCDDVVAETADISFGDAWVEPYSSDGRGTNVVVVRSLKIHKMLTDALIGGRLTLQSVDGAFVEQTQAAGLRQRREGLAYRLSWASGSMVRPLKRVAPDADTAAPHRRAIYRMRYRISVWSHRVFRFARRINQPWVYISWARMSGAIYHGIAYHKGNITEMRKRYKEWVKG